ncbi:helix-turn-helix transcriptional regulator [Glycomyces sp. YM15]|uniref:helix-turn-helix domain-containing protein n=1 Tax=Glycomyces sp. YM15 TaxID=2800446 RepID=UPI0023DD53AA|nr:helix-turn-helix transcriptional regulator [Glycomyces sp. YM15]
MTVSENGRVLGRTIRTLRERAGRFSRTEFARACHTSESHLRNIENGHKVPSKALLAAIENELGTSGVLAQLAESTHLPTQRRSLLRTLNLAGAVFPDIDEATPAARIDPAVMRSMTTTLRDLDNRHGGGHAHHSIAAYFDNLANPTLTGARSDAERQLLAPVVAELALVAGWSAFDAGIASAARRYFDQARTIAHTASLKALECEIVIAISNRAAIAGDANEAVNAAEGAVRAAAAIGDWSLTGEARMALAHGIALTGDAKATSRAINAAATNFDRADRVDAPAWIAHVGEGWFDGRIAQCLRLTADHRSAAAAAERTAALAKPGPRGNSLNLAHCALVMFAASRPEEAARYAMQALQAGRTVHSARLDSYRWQIAAAARPFTGVEAVAELESVLAEH